MHSRKTAHTSRELADLRLAMVEVDHPVLDVKHVRLDPGDILALATVVPDTEPVF